MPNSSTANVYPCEICPNPARGRKHDLAAQKLKGDGFTSEICPNPARGRKRYEYEFRKRER